MLDAGAMLASRDIVTAAVWTLHWFACDLQRNDMNIAPKLLSHPN
jgi:hypothetical protein